MALFRVAKASAASGQTITKIIDNGTTHQNEYITLDITSLYSDYANITDANILFVPKKYTLTSGTLNNSELVASLSYTPSTGSLSINTGTSGHYVTAYDVYVIV